MKNIILITGCAGFIGFHLAKKLLKKTKFLIIGIDNMNNYYSTKIQKMTDLVFLKNFKEFYFF